MTRYRTLTHKLLRNTADIRRSFRIAFLAGIALATIFIGQLPRAGAQAATPAYVLGVSSPTDPLVIDLENLTSSVTILPGVSSLSILSPNSVLFIDGNWLQSASSIDPTIISTILASVLNGLPTIVVRGNAALLQQSISGLAQLRMPNLPLISDGIRIFNTLADGTRQALQLLVLAGFDYAVNTEFAWAQKVLSPTAMPTTSPALRTISKPLAIMVPAAISSSSICSNTANTTDACWQFIFSATIDTGTDFSPYGRVSSSFILYHLINSGSSSYTWNNLFLNETVLPGIAVFNSSWRNLTEQDQVTNQVSVDTIVNHGPASLMTTGPTLVSFTLGVTNGIQFAAVTANQTATYSLKNTNVTDLTGGSQAAWRYDINTRADSGKLPLQLSEGITDRVASGYPMKVAGGFATTFAEINGQVIDGTQSISQGYSLCGFTGGGPSNGC